jgi:MFS transporter, AAHS family, 3-hydroxyphenylpropionic acid transporter
MQGSKIRLPVLFALLIALGVFDGFDIASIGQTLSRIIKTFGLDSTEAGIVASVSMLGLAIGAYAGGRLADIVGGKAVVLVSTLLLGLGSLATAAAWDYPSLVAIRLATGLGIGGLMALVVATVGDTVAEDFRSTSVSLLMASGAGGGMVAGFVALRPEWRVVFYVGGIGPLACIPAVLRWYPRRGTPAAAGPAVLPARPAREILFGDQRGIATLLMWVVMFTTSLVSYILINWLPKLLVQQGASETAGHLALILYSLGGVVGNVSAGIAMDSGRARMTYSIGYLGASACIAGLAFGVSGGALLALAFATNLCILGAQLITFAIAPRIYREVGRSTGVGAMVSAGRLGSVVGPFLVGVALHAGLVPRQVLLGLIPGFILAWLLGLRLASTPRAVPAPTRFVAPAAEHEPSPAP